MRYHCKQWYAKRCLDRSLCHCISTYCPSTIETLTWNRRAIQHSDAARRWWSRLTIGGVVNSADIVGDAEPKPFWDRTAELAELRRQRWLARVRCVQNVSFLGPRRFALRPFVPDVQLLILPAKLRV